MSHLSRQLSLRRSRWATVTHGAEPYSGPATHRYLAMPDPTSMAEARARLVKTSPTPLELVGRSTAIARVHELMRRAALADGGVLLVADRGADVTSVAAELHARTRRAAATFVQVDCASSDPARLDEWLFGTTPESASGDLEWFRKTARSPRTSAERSSCRTSSSCRRQCRLDSRALRATAKCGSTDSRSPTNLRWVASAAPGLEADVHDEPIPQRSLSPAVEIADRPAAAPRAARRCAGAGDECARRLVRRANGSRLARSRKPRSRCSPR